MLTEQNKINLDKLATYLENLPKDYSHFSMKSYYDSNGSNYDSEIIAYVNCKTNFCGTVACAVGHGPAAGICMTEGETGPYSIDWNLYSSKFTNEDLYFAHDDVDRIYYDWLFSGRWRFIDNTHQGAAARIRFLLDDNKIPRDFQRTLEHLSLNHLLQREAEDILKTELIDTYSNYIKE